MVVEEIELQELNNNVKDDVHAWDWNCSCERCTPQHWVPPQNNQTVDEYWNDEDNTYMEPRMVVEETELPKLKNNSKGDLHSVNWDCNCDRCQKIESTPHQSVPPTDNQTSDEDSHDDNNDDCKCHQCREENFRYEEERRASNEQTYWRLALFDALFYQSTALPFIQRVEKNLPLGNYWLDAHDAQEIAERSLKAFLKVHYGKCYDYQICHGHDLESLAFPTKETLLSEDGKSIFNAAKEMEDLTNAGRSLSVSTRYVHQPRGGHCQFETNPQKSFTKEKAIYLLERAIFIHNTVYAYLFSVVADFVQSEDYTFSPYEVILQEDEVHVEDIDVHLKPATFRKEDFLLQDSC